MFNVFDITDFGAVADKKTDCTSAIQAAIDAAEKVKGTVVVPPGVYLCGEIFMKPSVNLTGFRGWGYRENGGSILLLNDDKATCLINMTGAFGACVHGIQLLGNHVLGENIHGISIVWKDYETRENYDIALEDNVLPEETQIGFREDSVVVSDCQVKNFSGDAVHFENIWAFTLRDSMFIANKGNAVYIRGWDGWIYNCIMHTNHGAAIYSDTVCASVTVSDNRIEWNRGGGISAAYVDSMNITGNFFDRSYGPAIKIVGRANAKSRAITIVGNIFRRSGKRSETEQNPYYNSHIYLENCTSVTASTNSFAVGKDDRNCGIMGPDYSIVTKNSDTCVISGNVMRNGAVKENITVLGENDNLIIKDNPSSLYEKQ